MLTLLGAAGLLLAYRKDIPATASAVIHARPAWLELLALLALAGVAFVGLMFRDGQIAAGVAVGRREGLALGSAAYAVNLVVKSSGLAGMAVLLRWGRARGQPQGAVVGGYLVSTFLNHVAFAVVLVAALVTVSLGGHLTTIDVIAACLFAVYVAVHVAAAWAALRRPELLHSAHALMHRGLKALRRVARRPPSDPSAVTSDGAAELITALAVARARPLRVARAAGWAQAVDLVHVVWLWAALHAVGASAGLDVALVAYGIATLFGILGFLPAGLGFVEVGMTAALTSYNIGLSEAAAAVVLFRAAELWLPLAVGFGASRWLRRREVQP